MNSSELLRKLSYESAQETYTAVFGEDEVAERVKDLRCIDGSVGKALLVGTSDSEMEAWHKKFGKWPVGVSLDNRWKNSFIVNEDMHELSFKNEYFDFVYCSQTLEHSPAPIIALSQIARVLKSKGKFFFWIPFDWGNQIVKYHYSCFSPEIWIDLIKKAGLLPNVFCQDSNSFGYYGNK